MAGSGAHIILGREDAKQLFGKSDDASVRTFVTGLRGSRKHRESHLILDIGSTWDPIHRCLTDGTLEPEGGEFPLNHCILGGRRLHKGPGFEAVLIRPDIVPHVAESMHHMKRQDLHGKYFSIDAANYGQAPSEQEFDKVWLMLQQIRKLFEDAAMDRCAVLFTVER